jgi:hypothetical protein
MPRKSGIWETKTGRRPFRTSSSASQYFFEELRKILEISPKDFKKKGFGVNYKVEIEISLGFIPETVQEFRAFVAGAKILIETLGQPRVMNTLIKEAFIYGVIKTQSEGQEPGLGLKDLWHGGGYDVTVGGAKAVPLREDRTSAYDAISGNKYPVKSRSFKSNQFTGTRRSLSLTDLGNAIRDAFESSVKVSNQRAALPSPFWFAQKPEFNFTVGKSRKPSRYTSAFMLLEFGSGIYAKKGWIRPYTSARATPYKVPSEISGGGEGAWYSYLSTSRRVHDYLRLAKKSKLTAKEKRRLAAHTRRTKQYAAAERPGRLSRDVLFDKRGQLSLQRAGRKDFIKATQIRFLELLNKRVRSKLGGKNAALWQDSFLLGIIKYK